MESSVGAAAEKDGIRVTARKPATTPPPSKRLHNVDTKMCAANDDMRTFLHVTRNLLSFARSQASGTDHELALSLLWRPAISLGAGASAAPVRRTLRRSIQTGLVVRAGAPKPDIGSVDQFRKVLLSAKSIAYSDSGSGRFIVEAMLAS